MSSANGGREEAWPSTDLGNDERDAESDSHPLCDRLCGLATHTHTPHLPPGCPVARLLVCKAAALCRLIEVDCGIISLVKFFHFLRLSLLSSHRPRAAERRPSSLLSSGRGTPHPITADHCLNYSSRPLPPLSPLFLLSPPISSPIAPRYSPLFFFPPSLPSPPQEVGKILAHAYSRIAPSFQVSSWPVIRISQMSSDYLYLDLETPPPPASSARKFSESAFSIQDGFGKDS